MNIGIAGPVATASFAEFFDSDISGAPAGLGPSDIVQLVKGLLGGGHKVSIYTLSPGITDHCVIEGKKLKIYFGRYRLRGRERIKDFFSIESNYIKKFILADNPDIVHAHWTYEFAIGALKSKRRLLVTVWDWAPRILRYSPDLYRFGRFLMNTYTLWRAQDFTVVSPYIQKQLFRYKGINYPVVPSMLDDSLFKRRKRILDKQKTKIVSINNGFGKRKNVMSLFIAFNGIRKKLPSCELVLVGNSFSQGEAAEQWASEHKLSQGVSYLGPIPHSEVLELLGEVDLLIHPSREEAFGMTLLEAMARGTPVIGGYDSGAVPWVLGYGKAGILVDVTSPNRIAEEAVSILTDALQWQNYSEAGYTYAWENFRLSKVVEQYLNIYRGILAHKS